MDRLTTTRAYYFTFFVLVLSTLFGNGIDSSSVVQLQSHNIQQVLDSHDLVLVNFYADWCRFSQILTPIYDEAATKVKKEFPEEGKVALAKVDCDRESGIASQYHVNKYPTLKLFRHGNLVKKEYRGQRSADAIGNFIKDQLVNPVNVVASLEDLEELDGKKRHIIGYFEDDTSRDFQAFSKSASLLKDDCSFHAAIGPVSQDERTSGNRVVFKPTLPATNEVPYTGNIADENFFQVWANDKCVPLVREITFENAEELTEEGLPFLILFHDPSDLETPDAFKRLVTRELLSEKNSVNFLTADGNKFSHPLYHLGKTTKDLPVLAIDSFRHMYLWKQNPKTEIEKPGQVKQFIADLHSGKLHREFHHGPDPTAAPSNQIENQKTGHIPHDKTDSKPKSPTTPPESIFKKLAPSRTRYTVLRDEL